MTDWMQYHPTRPMTTPDGHTVDIDVEMVPLVTELWRLGYTTNLACQDTGEAILEGGTRTAEADRPRAAARNMGRAWLIVRAEQGPRLLHACRTLNDGGQWKLLPVIKGDDPESWISVTFPREHINDAADLLRTLGPAFVGREGLCGE